MTNIAIENGPVKIVSFPIKSMEIFPGYAHVYQGNETFMGTITVVFLFWDLPWEVIFLVQPSRSINYQLGLPSGNECYIANWKITIRNGKSRYFYGHFPVRYVCLPEGMWDSNNKGMGIYF